MIHPSAVWARQIARSFYRIVIDVLILRCLLSFLLKASNFFWVGKWQETDSIAGLCEQEAVWVILRTVALWLTSRELALRLPLSKTLDFNVTLSLSAELLYICWSHHGKSDPYSAVFPHSLPCSSPQERRASLLRRSQARESRIDTMRSSRMPCRMAMSCVIGAAGGAAGDAALAALSRPRVAFGSSSPRDICRPLTVEPDPLAAVLNQGTVAGRSSSAFHVGCLLSAHARSHRRAASAPGERTQAARVRRDMRTGYVPPRPASARTAPDKERQSAWKAARSVGPSAANSGIPNGNLGLRDRKIRKESSVGSQREENGLRSLLDEAG